MPADQLNLLGSGADRLQTPRRAPVDHEALARERLGSIIATARAARSMPWSEREARMWRTVVPQMANWLPEAEADEMRAEFAREIERLETAGRSGIR